MIKSRIAPTPSGYLHLGNAFNFLLTSKLVQKNKGQLQLRIDDADGDRCRDEYLEDIFEVFSWLDIQWHSGPKDVQDFKQNYSQQKKTKHFWQNLSEFSQKSSRVYGCECSRSQIKKISPSGIYPGTCREKGLSFKEGQKALRFVVHGEDLQKKMGDFVIWRKNNTPAYQWFSLLEDIENDINFIVRGEDLLLSTMAQRELAKEMGEKGRCFVQAHVIHHPLLQWEGAKLSKSQNHPALKKNQWEKDWLNEQVDSYLEKMA